MLEPKARRDESPDGGPRVSVMEDETVLAATLKKARKGWGGPNLKSKGASANGLSSFRPACPALKTTSDRLLVPQKRPWASPAPSLSRSVFKAPGFFPRKLARTVAGVTCAARAGK